MNQFKRGFALAHNALNRLCGGADQLLRLSAVRRQPGKRENRDLRVRRHVEAVMRALEEQCVRTLLCDPRLSDQCRLRFDVN